MIVNIKWIFFSRFRSLYSFRKHNWCSAHDRRCFNTWTWQQNGSRRFGWKSRFHDVGRNMSWRLCRFVISKYSLRLYGFAIERFISVFVRPSVTVHVSIHFSVFIRDLSSSCLIRMFPIYRVQFLRYIKDFFGVTFKLEPYRDVDSEKQHLLNKVMVTCMGIGYNKLI